MSRKQSWITHRLPFGDFWQRHFSGYPIPNNLNLWYVFGVLLMVSLAIQLLSGLVLAMYYVPTEEGAFASIIHIMRDVEFGWLIRYLHTTGASAIFLLMYLHLFRGLLYGSYKAPRELVWVVGMLLYLLLMAEAFFGYLLPWGQLSFWGAKVIISLLGAIPWVGDQLVLWIQGDYLLSGATLGRFFALHVIGIPLLLGMTILMHMIALHHVGSSNPEGDDTWQTHHTGDDNTKVNTQYHVEFSQYNLENCVPFYPYGVLKDLVAVAGFLTLFFAIVFFFPTGGGVFLEADNLQPANPLITPEHIRPLWYFTPFYTLLRIIPDKEWGAICMLLAIFLPIVLPWIDKHRLRSVRQRGKWHRANLMLLAVSFTALGVVSYLPPTSIVLAVGRTAALGYFFFYLFLGIYSHRGGRT